MQEASFLAPKIELACPQHWSTLIVKCTVTTALRS